MTLGRLDYPREDIYLRLDSRHAPTRVRSCAKEPWTVDWLERFVTRGDTLYDIGANVGAYSLVAAKQADGEVRVVAIEPGYASFAALCENIILNGAADRIYPFGVTLGESTALAYFNYRDLESGSGLHSVGDRPFLEGPFVPIYRQPVLTFRLDELIEQFALPPPNHLKLDVDGAELEVLKGAGGVLRSSSLRSAMVEVNEEDAEAITELLTRNGLVLRSRHDPVTALGHWYGLFTRASGSTA